MNRLRKIEQHMTQLSFTDNMHQQTVQREMLEHLRHHDVYIVTGRKRNGGELNYAYSVGLWLSCQHPEIITMDLPETRSRLLLSDMRNLITLGYPPPISTPFGKPVGEYPVQLEPIHNPKIVREYLPMADWFYGGENFPVLQLFGNHLNDESDQE